MAEEFLENESTLYQPREEDENTRNARHHSAAS
jgi:hypothetical protein